MHKMHGNFDEFGVHFVDGLVYNRKYMFYSYGNTCIYDIGLSIILVLPMILVL